MNPNYNLNPNPRGSVRCVPVGGTYDDTTLQGGPGGIGVDNCPSGYNYLGKHCYLDSVDNAIFPDAKKRCGREVFNSPISHLKLRFSDAFQ